ncbi:hypothetical protein B0H13DRAFT_918933 [Mycena leptocephala]|nr:hypothetical protein B0H13DRAFT_918933 [Mycena leptocephala]
MLPQKIMDLVAQCPRPNVSLILVVRHSRVPRALIEEDLQRLGADIFLGRTALWVVARREGRMLRYSPPLSPRHTLRLVNSRDNWRRSFQTIINCIVVAVLVSFLVLTKFLAFYTVGSDCWVISDDARHIGSTMPTRLYSTVVSGHFLSCSESYSGLLLPPISS